MMKLDREKLLESGALLPSADRVDLQSGIYRYFPDQLPDAFATLTRQLDRNKPAAILTAKDAVYYIPMDADPMPPDWRATLSRPIRLTGMLVGGYGGLSIGSKILQAVRKRRKNKPQRFYDLVYPLLGSLAGGFVGYQAGAVGSRYLPGQRRLTMREVPRVEGIYPVREIQDVERLPKPQSRAQMDAISDLEYQLKALKKMQKKGSVVIERGSYIQPEYHNPYLVPRTENGLRNRAILMTLGALAGGIIGGSMGANDGDPRFGMLFGGGLGAIGGFFGHGLWHGLKALKDPAPPYYHIQDVYTPKGKLMAHQIFRGPNVGPSTRLVYTNLGTFATGLPASVAGGLIFGPVGARYGLSLGSIGGVMAGKNIGHDGRFGKRSPQISEAFLVDRAAKSQNKDSHKSDGVKI